MNQFWYDGQLIEGEQIKLSLFDPGFLYGATVFTTLRVWENSLDHRLTFWDAHLDRLRKSINKFNWCLPDFVKIREGAQRLKSYFPVLRITIFPDGKELIMGRNLPQNLRENQRQGIKVWVAEDPLFQRSLAQDKTGNYLGPWLALQKAHSLGYQETILQDGPYHWLETATGNLWGYGHGIFYTPPITGRILSGVMRNHLLITLKSHHFSVEIKPFTKELINSLESLFYTNVVVQIMPITQVFVNQSLWHYKIDSNLLETVISLL